MLAARRFISSVNNFDFIGRMELANEIFILVYVLRTCPVYNLITLIVLEIFPFTFRQATKTPGLYG